MRYGVSIDARQRRYLVDSHEDRPDFIGLRRSDRVPEFPYPDTNQFFGSGGFQREDGAWMPSRAEVVAYLYHVRGIERAFRGTTAESAPSPYLLTVRKLRMELEFRLISDDYRMSFHHYGVGRSIPHSAHFAERRGLELQIAGIEKRIRRARRRLVLRRTLGAALAVPVTLTRRLYPSLWTVTGGLGMELSRVRASGRHSTRPGTGVTARAGTRRARAHLARMPSSVTCCPCRARHSLPPGRRSACCVSVLRGPASSACRGFRALWTR